jgi:hypothetical protein
MYYSVKILTIIDLTKGAKEYFALTELCIIWINFHSSFPNSSFTYFFTFVSEYESS